MSAGFWSEGAASLIAMAALLLGLLGGGLAGMMLARRDWRLREREIERTHRPTESELRRLRDELREARAVQAGLVSAIETMRKSLADSESRLAAAEAEAARTRGPVPGRRRPPALAAPRDGRPDDLRRIGGIGPGTARLLQVLGIHHFEQIAAWTPEEVAFVEDHVAQAGGFVLGDDWAGQARRLGADGKEVPSDLGDDLDK